MPPQHKESGRAQRRVRRVQQGQHFRRREATGLHLLQRIQGAGLDCRIGVNHAPAGWNWITDFQQSVSIGVEKKPVSAGVGEGFQQSRHRLPDAFLAQQGGGFATDMGICRGEGRE